MVVVELRASSESKVCNSVNVVIVSAEVVVNVEGDGVDCSAGDGDRGVDSGDDGGGGVDGSAGDGGGLVNGGGAVVVQVMVQVMVVV